MDENEEAKLSIREKLLEEALIEYVERYGLSEKARSALKQVACDFGKSNLHKVG